ncbi:MAG: hypothetical protein IC227_01640 [Enterococcus lacertideformus]|uniref:Uncharacterized protein n=1 Tax=Enterococcus lacertideformus TaxID=2771493 RepID=A0A931F809_9ENTE|nr:hypothetical protein [Enterococcus lacertideformus]
MAKHREEEYEYEAGSQPKNKPYSKAEIDLATDIWMAALKKTDHSNSNKYIAEEQRTRKRLDEMKQHNENIYGKPQVFQGHKREPIIPDQPIVPEKTAKEKHQERIEKAKKEPVHKIAEFENKANSVLAEIEAERVKFINKRDKIVDEKTGSIKELDLKINKFKELKTEGEKQQTEISTLEKSYETKQKRINSIDQSFFKKLINLFTGEKSKLMQDLATKREKLASKKETFSKLLNNKNELKSELLQILPVITKHCAEINNEYTKVYPELEARLLICQKS